MATPSSVRFVDHPAPSVSVVVLLLVTMAALLAAIPAAIRDSGDPHTPVFLVVVIGASLATVCFYFWPFYTTYYTVSAAGIGVSYGPWKREYPWSDFGAAFWQKGMFATRIGWPSVTPCVRLTNAVLLKRKSKRFGLYLTPNDPRAFLQRVAEFAPELTRETIL